MRDLPSDQDSAARVHGPIVSAPRDVLCSKPSLTLLCLSALLGALQLQPFERYRLLSPGSREQSPAEQPRVAQVVGEAELESESIAAAELVQPEDVSLPTNARGPIAQSSSREELPSLDAEAPPVAIEDPSGSLHGFYEALANTALKRPGAITRVSHFGDSLVASDYVTATLRRRLQDAFGDAGHGFSLMANAWPSYFHNDVYRFASSGWKVSRIVGPYAKDGFYGLGGVSFSAPPGVRSHFGTSLKGSYGRQVSRFSVLYLKQPLGGAFRLNLDQVRYADIDTENPVSELGVAEVRTPDGEHLLELLTTRGTVRAFGVVMERDAAGVVLDALGIQGARIRFLDKQDDAHYRQVLAWRQPNLIIYHFGANESGDGFAYSMEEFRDTMKHVLRQGQKAVPGASCLVMAAMDRARKVESGLITVPIIPHIVKEQRHASIDVGCAFFNTFDAMGGRGSMARWVRRGLGQADLTHPTGVGAEIIGNWVYQALAQGYRAHHAAKQQP